MSDNPLCVDCPHRAKPNDCLNSGCRLDDGYPEYREIPAICQEMRCREVKECNDEGYLKNCSELQIWRDEHPGICPFCECLEEGFHKTGCPGEDTKH